MPDGSHRECMGERCGTSASFSLTLIGEDFTVLSEDYPACDRHVRLAYDRLTTEAPPRAAAFC